MNGKIRVSIVATALDGHKTQNNTVLNMVDRIHNRNPGYSDGLFSPNNNIENNTFNSIEGATALKLDEKFEANEQEPQSEINSLLLKTPAPESDNEKTNIPTGVSIENAAYMETNDETLSMPNENIEPSIYENEEHTPQLFSNEFETSKENNSEDTYDAQNEKLFDQDLDEEEDFEIPAFLRKQKF